MTAPSPYADFVTRMIIPVLQSLGQKRDVKKADDLIGKMLTVFPVPTTETRFVRIEGEITADILIALAPHEIPVAVTNAIMDYGVALSPAQGTNFWKLSERYIDVLSDDEVVVDGAPLPEPARVEPVPDEPVKDASDDGIRIEAIEQSMFRTLIRAKDDTGTTLAFAVHYHRQRNASLWTRIEVIKLRADKDCKYVIHNNVDHDEVVELVRSSAKS